MALSSKRWIKDNADCLLSEDMFTWIWHKGEERERSRCDGPPLAGRRGEQLKNENPTKLFPTKVIEWQGRSLQSRSYEEVALSKIQEQTTNALFKVRDIIAACRQDRAIELVVSRDSALTARRNHPREGLGEAELARWVRKLKLSHIIVPPILGRRFTHLNLETWAVGYRCDMKHWFKLIFFWFPVPPSRFWKILTPNNA